MAVTPNLPASDYHAILAMSAGMAWTMDADCAYKAWLNSPWNGAREAVNATHFDIGTACHLAVLEPELFRLRALVHEFEDYRSKDARQIRDDCYAAGVTPLKPSELVTVEGIAEAIQRHPVARDLLRNGECETTIEWTWEGVACKARPDFLAADRSYVLDLKSANTCNPRAVARKAALEGWHVRACWYTGGCKESTGTLPDKYLYLTVEKDRPHLVEIYELEDKALIYGEQIVMRSLRRTAECLATGKWPGYGDGQIVKLNLPTWSEFQRAEREEAGDFDQ